MRSLVCAAALLIGCGDDVMMMQSGGAGGGSGGSGADGGTMSCPPGPDIMAAQPADHPIYPAPRLLAQSGLGAQVHTACVDTGALARHDALDRLVPELLTDAGLVQAAAGSDPCACDLKLTFVAAPPALTGDAQAAWMAAGTNPERLIAVTQTENGRATATLHAPGGQRAALYALRQAL